MIEENIKEKEKQLEERTIGITHPKAVRGRPPKITSNPAAKNIHTAIPQEDWELLYYNLKGRTVGETLSYLIRSQFSSDGEISALKQEEAELTAQLAITRSRIVIEEEKEKERRKRALIEDIEQRYPGLALKHLIRSTLRNSPSATEISTKPEFIEERYGIICDLPKLNSEFREISVDYEEIPDVAIAKKYACKRKKIGSLAPEFIPSEFLALMKRDDVGQHDVINGKVSR
jgi:hypothetical protein